MQLRQLTTIEEFRQVYALEREVWHYTSSDDQVPVPILIVSAKIGGLLIGAFDEARLVGFAYSMPGIAGGRAFQWSHMLGVADSHRDRGVGWTLKLEQRRLTLEMGLELIEWTYDPLQALNAHLNLVKLGAIVRQYHEDVYGESSSPLHRGTPTDRFVAEWWLRSARVEDRLESAGAGRAEPAFLPGEVEAVNEVRAAGPWLAPVRHDLSMDAARLAVVIPVGFTEMQCQDPGLAQAWRASTREIFTTYLPRGFEVVDVAVDRRAGRGVYLLERNPER
jgi:predicted GNAT superfamily acetyltransferase